MLAAGICLSCAFKSDRVEVGGSDTAPANANASPGFRTDDPAQALLGWLDAVYHAERSLNPNHPGLTKYGQGPALADVRKRIASFKAQGVRADKPDDIAEDPMLSAAGEVQGKKVTEVTVCLVEPADDFVDVKTGQPKAPKERGGTKAISSKFVGVMVLMPDGWHIDGNRVEDVGSCSTTR